MLIHHIVKIPGEPEGNRRPRGRTIRTGTDEWGEAIYSCRMHKHEADRLYQQMVQDIWCLTTQIKPAGKGVPVEVKIHAVHQLPESMSEKKRRELYGKPCTKKPDADNIAKNILDALTHSGKAWTDDSQVTLLHTEKRWANPGEEAHVRVEVSWDDGE